MARNEGKGKEKETQKPTDNINEILLPEVITRILELTISQYPKAYPKLRLVNRQWHTLSNESAIKKAWISAPKKWLYNEFVTPDLVKKLESLEQALLAANTNKKIYFTDFFSSGKFDAHKMFANLFNSISQYFKKISIESEKATLMQRDFLKLFSSENFAKQLPKMSPEEFREHVIKKISNDSSSIDNNAKNGILKFANTLALMFTHVQDPSLVTKIQAIIGIRSNELALLTTEGFSSTDLFDAKQAGKSIRKSKVLSTTARYSDYANVARKISKLLRFAFLVYILYQVSKYLSEEKNEDEITNSLINNLRYFQVFTYASIPVSLFVLAGLYLKNKVRGRTYPHAALLDTTAPTLASQSRQGRNSQRFFPSTSTAPSTSSSNNKKGNSTPKPPSPQKKNQ